MKIFLGSKNFSTIFVDNDEIICYNIDVIDVIDDFCESSKTMRGGRSYRPGTPNADVLRGLFYLILFPFGIDVLEGIFDFKML